MRRIGLALAAAAVVPLLGSCAESPRAVRVPEPAQVQPAAAHTPPTDADLAQDLYEQARKSVQAGAFADGLQLLEQAFRLDPGSSRIRNLYNEVVRILNHRPGEFTLEECRPDAGISEQLLRVRGELALLMSSVGDLADQERWNEVAGELEHAANLARQVLELAASSGNGRLCDAWSSRGLESMRRGEYGAATVFFEIASLEVPGLEFHARSLRAECLARRIAECQALDRRVAVPAPGRIFSPPPRRRDKLISPILVVARSRFLVGEFEEVQEDLRLLATLSPESAEPRRYSAALSLLPAFDPWESIAGYGACRQRDLTAVLRNMRAAQGEESHGSFKMASELFEQSERDLRSFPHSAGFKVLQAEAQSSAARCRRLAEDASR